MSAPAFRPFRMPRRPTPFLVSLLLLTGVRTPAGAQRADSARAGVRPPAVGQPVRDSLKPPVSPGRAFLLSLALPGLGQSRLDRGTAGTMYFLFESISATMLTKSYFDLRIAKQHVADSIVASYKTNPDGSPLLDAAGNPVPGTYLRNRYAGTRKKARRTHVEDWIATLAFNHLFAGADAFVSSHLWDLPVRVGFRAAAAAAIVTAFSRY